MIRTTPTPLLLTAILLMSAACKSETPKSDEAKAAAEAPTAAAKPAAAKPAAPASAPAGGADMAKAAAKPPAPVDNRPALDAPALIGTWDMALAGEQKRKVDVFKLAVGDTTTDLKMSDLKPQEASFVTEIQGKLEANPDDPMLKAMRAAMEAVQKMSLVIAKDTITVDLGPARQAKSSYKVVAVTGAVHQVVVTREGNVQEQQTLTVEGNQMTVTAPGMPPEGIRFSRRATP